MRDVHALDAQRGVRQLEGLLQLGEGERAGGEVAGPPHPVPGEGLLGVALDGLHQVALVAALGHPQRDLAAAQLLEQLGVDVGVLGELGHQHLAGHGLPRLADAGLLVDAAVDLQQELLDQLAGGDRLDLVDDPAALAAHPPAADVEDLDRGLQLVLGEGHDVGVRAVAEDDGLLLQRPPERAEVVAEPGGLLELERLRRGGHLALEPLDHRLGLAGHEVAEVVDDLAVLLGGDPADAGCRALADVAEQAGPADLAGALEHAVGAGTRREDAGQGVERFADRPGVGVGPEVADALLLRPAHHLQPRELLVQRDREARVALVVAVADVEPRVELLDPVVLELEGLDLGADDGPVDAPTRSSPSGGCAGAGRRRRRSSCSAAGAGSWPCRRR